MKRLQSLIFVGSLLCASVAMAQNQGGVQVGGDVTIRAKTGDVTTTADGENAIAETVIGSVTGDNTQVGGDVKIDVKTGDVTTTAKGKNSKACSTIGAVGTNACQKDDGGND